MGDGGSDNKEALCYQLNRTRAAQTFPSRELTNDSNVDCCVDVSHKVGSNDLVLPGVASRQVLWEVHLLAVLIPGYERLGITLDRACEVVRSVLQHRVNVWTKELRFIWEEKHTFLRSAAPELYQNTVDVAGYSQYTAGLSILLTNEAPSALIVYGPVYPLLRLTVGSTTLPSLNHVTTGSGFPVTLHRSSKVSPSTVLFKHKISGPTKQRGSARKFTENAIHECHLRE